MSETRKIAINVEHGGFSLNRKAFLRLRGMGNAAATKETDVGEFYSDGSGPRVGGYDAFCRDIPRDDPDLISLAEEMDVSGALATIRIVEIPSDVQWQIEEYDGREWVAEKHRTWDGYQ